MRVSKKALSLVLAITMVLSMIPGSLFYASTDRSTYANSKSYSDSQILDSGNKDSSIPVAVTGIELNKTELTLENGTSDTLTATVTPDGATNPKVFWTTSNSLVCTVDQNGKITAKKNGSAVITAITYDGGYSAKCNISVITTLTGLTLNKDKMTLAKGSSDSLIATEQPDGAPQQTILWTSSDTSVCTVDSLGVVTAVNAGTATVSAKTKDSGYTATCTVTVKNPVTGVTLNQTQLSLNRGKTALLTADITPTDATDKTVNWATSNSQVCTVDNGVVTAVNSGLAIITVKTVDGGYTAECKITVTTSVTGITLNKSFTTIPKGSQESLIATVFPADATNKNVSWLSTNPNTCTVDQSGTVSAINEGTAYIIASTSDGEYLAVCSVTVVTAVTGITLNKTSLDLNKGNSETLTATVLPDDATIQKVSWSTSNSSVCTVDQNGKVTAVGNGSAKITVMTPEGGYTATCQVNVTTPVTGISLQNTSVQLTKGTKDTLVATITPSDATVKDVTWSSSDDNVCSVDSSGTICAMNAGTAEITVKTKDGNYTAQCTVTVVIPVTGVTLNKSDVTLEKGSTETLTATVVPADATDQSLAWTSSDQAVCTVDQNGKITAKGNGSAVITVTMFDGSYTATCNVTVRTSVTGVSLDKTVEKLTKGSKETLTATITPADASDKVLKWTSSNNNVCTVDDSGTISAVDAGSAVITVETDNGGYTAFCAVTVVIPVTGVTLNKSETSITKGKSETLTGTVSPSDATDQKVSWKSSDETIAVVDQTGNITALSVGTATITATTDDGGFTAQCLVTVTPDYFTVTANATNGKVDGAKTYPADSTVVLKETPNTGYHFVNWTDSAGNVLGTDSTYTIPKLSANVAVTANFIINRYTVTAIATTGGAVKGGNIQYDYGNPVTLTAYAADHYHFTNWTINGVVVGTDTTYKINSISADVTVVANFAIDTFTVTITAGSGGSVTGAVTGTYNFGTPLALTAIPSSGYHFTGWTDGNLDNPRGFTVTADASYTAVFAPDYDCTAKLYTNSQYSIVLNQDGSFSCKFTDRKNSMMENYGHYYVDLFDLTFDYPINYASYQTIGTIYNAQISSDTDLGTYMAVWPTAGTWTDYPGWIASWTGGQNNSIICNGVSKGSTYTLHFAADYQASRNTHVYDRTITWPAGSLTINGHQIKHIKIVQ